MSVQDTLDFDPRRAVITGGADTRPPPPWYEVHWDSTKAAIADNFQDVPGRAAEQRNAELLAGAAQLARLNGKDPTTYQISVMGEPGGNMPTLNSPAFWADLDAWRRAGHPDALKDLGADEADFDKRRLGRLHDEAGQRAEAMAKQGVLGNLLGGAIGGFTDPINILTMPLGGGGAKLAGQTIGKALWAVGKSAVREGAINAAVELGETPFRQLERRDVGGPDITAGDVGMGVASAFVGGAAFDMAGSAVGKAYRETRLAINPDYLAEGQMRAGAAALRKAVPNYALTPQQVASLHIVERYGSIHEASPYVDRYEENASHAAKVDEFVRGWTAPADQRVPPAPGSVSRPATRTAGTLNGQIITYLHRAGLTDAQARGVAAGIHAESRGDPTAFNPAGGGKGAFGIGQWRGARLDRLRERYGPNPSLEQQVEFLVGELRGGDPGGHKVLGQADEAAVLRSYINDFMRPAQGAETSGDLARGMAALGRAGEQVPGAAEAAGLDPGAPPERAPELDAERPGVPMPAEVAPAPQLDRAKFPDDASFRVAQASSDAAHFGTDPSVTWGHVLEEQRAELEPQLQKILADKRVNLNNPERLSARLGVQPELVREALLDLAKRGELDTLPDGTGFARRPVAQGPAKAVDVLEFIASHGGIRDDEGHNLGLVTQRRKHKDESDLSDAEVKRRRQFGNRNLQKMTRRGPLLRKAGKSVDDIGELLHESGYLSGADGGRPTEREVIDFLDQRISTDKPALPDEAATRGGEGTFELPTREEEVWHTRQDIADAAAEHYGVHELDDDFLNYAAELKVDKGLEPAEAFAEAVNHYAGDEAREFFDDPAENLGAFGDDWPFDDSEPRSQDYVDAEFLRRYEPAGSEATEGEGDPWAARGGEGEAGQLDPAQRDEAAADLAGSAPVPDPEAHAQFDDPRGEGVAEAADSAWHDINAADEAEAARSAPLTDDEFKAIWADKDFKKTHKALGAPHRESPVAAAEARGWRDGKAGNLDAMWAELAEVSKGFSAMRPHGFNPGQSYFEGFLGALTGEAREVRGIGESDRYLNVFQAYAKARELLAEGAGKAEAPGLDLGEAVDPAIARRQAQEAQLMADQPLRGERKTGEAQQGVMPEGLFGGAEEPAMFDIGDGKGARPVADIAAELDAEQAGIDAIKGCLL
jgi:Phage tail lysozyme